MSSKVHNKFEQQNSRFLFIIFSSYCEHNTHVITRLTCECADTLHLTQTRHRTDPAVWHTTHTSTAGCIGLCSLTTPAYYQRRPPLSQIPAKRDWLIRLTDWYHWKHWYDWKKGLSDRLTDLTNQQILDRLWHIQRSDWLDQHRMADRRSHKFQHPTVPGTNKDHIVKLAIHCPNWRFDGDLSVFRAEIWLIDWLTDWFTVMSDWL